MCELPSLICALEHCHEAKEFLFAASHGFSWMGKVMLFFLFPSLKKHLKGQRFHSNEDVISAGEEWFESHPKSYYAQGLLKVKERWQKCVDMQGDYVEK